MEELTGVEARKALKDLRAKVREIAQTIDAGKRQPLYKQFEDLQGMAHDAKRMVAEGGKWSDHHESEES